MTATNPFMHYVETGQIDFSEGHLKFFDQSMIMLPTSTYINLYKKLNMLGQPGKKILYDIGFEQIKAIFSVFEAKYNVSDMDADSFVRLFGPTIMLGGWGEIEFSQIKFKKGETCIVVVKNNPFAALYKKMYSQQKNSVDSFLLGLLGGGFSCITGCKVDGNETKCIAKGDAHCEFVFKLS